MRFITAIFLIIGAGAVFFFYTKPAYDGLDALRAQVAQYDQALEKSKELLQVQSNLLAQYNNFTEEDKDRLQKLLPDTVDNIQLILDISSLAVRHGLTLENVDVDKVSTTNSNSGSGTIGGDERPYDSISLKFSTRSSYANFQAFLKDLEASLRIVDLTTLSISKGDTTSGSQIYQYDITLKTYWLK